MSESRMLPLLTWRAALCDSGLEPTTRHVALTLSLYMSERGDSAHPGAVRLGKDTGLSERAVREHLAKLVAAGWLVVVERGGIKGERKRANAYAARVPEPSLFADPCTTVMHDAASPVTLTTPTPAPDAGHLSKNSPVKHSPTESAPTEKPRSPARRDPLFDALAEVCRINPTELTKPARGAMNAALKEFREVGATPDELRRRARIYERRYGSDRLTASALAKHWPSCAVEPVAEPAKSRNAEMIGRVLGAP